MSRVNSKDRARLLVHALSLVCHRDAYSMRGPSKLVAQGPYWHGTRHADQSCFVQPVQGPSCCARDDLDSEARSLRLSQLLWTGVAGVRCMIDVLVGRLGGVVREVRRSYRPPVATIDLCMAKVSRTPRRAVPGYFQLGQRRVNGVGNDHDDVD